jgi:hypothetical protein
MSIDVHPDVNSFEALVVLDDLRKRNIEYATLRPGNKCVWVSYNRVEAYYIFNSGRLVDVQID